MKKIINNKNNFYYILNETKLRLFYTLFTFLVTFLVCYFYSEKILYSMCKPFLLYVKKYNTQIHLHEKIHTYDYINLVFIDIYEAFYTNIFISFFFTLYLIMPFILYQIWCFFTPSVLYENKKNSLIHVVIFLVFIFLCIFLIHTFFLEKILYFFLNLYINNVVISINYMPRLKSYIILYTKIIFFFSFICTLPFICFFLIKKYVYFYITYKKKIPFQNIHKNKLKNIFFVLIISSIAAPPDIFLQFLLCLILYIFLEICICIIFIFIKIYTKK